MSFYVALMSFIDSLTDREDGQGLAEYALILALIAIVVIGVVTFLGGQITSIFSRIASAL
jgi:pilus assembly protein Flp/PilA